MWKTCASISLLWGLGALVCAGQGTVPTSPGGNRSSERPAQAGISAPNGGSFESNTFLEMANRVFNPDSDSMDFESGSFVWKGRSFDLSNQRAFRSRFERFLLSSPTPEEEEYARLLEEIRERLSVYNSGSGDDRDRHIFSTWELLSEAARFESDGGNSMIIADQVFNAWRIRQEARGAALSQRELENLRKYQQEVVANRALTLQRLRERRLQETSERQRDEGEANLEDPALTSEASFRALDLAETEARIVALETQAAATGVQAKLQFQSQIVTFLTQRRFEHALILSAFYQLIFKGSQQQLEVGRDQLTAFFPGSDLSFTVGTMAQVSREAISDINRGVQSVNAAYAEGRTMIALERLQETFFLGEYSSKLNKIPAAQRRHLLDLYRDMLEARELADAKDYNGVAELVERIAERAPDFPESRIMAAVETAKSLSNMAIFAAAQYRNLGDIDQARSELSRAIDIWPSNPAIREFQQETNRLATAGSQGVRVFDDMFERGDRRGIFDRRMELGFALADDTERLQVLTEVIDQISRIELLVSQSEESLRQGDPYVAWELLAEAAKIDSDDTRMNRARAELAPQVADFVVHLNRAERLSQSGQTAGALAAYLAAQDVYPASRICRVGIERESEALITALRERTATEE